MKKIIIVVILLTIPTTAHAALVDITDSTLPHFGDFINQLPNTPSDYSNISDDLATFGWHNSPSNGQSLSGILLGPNLYEVTRLRLQVHTNPFRDFILQGSTNTTTGFDGDWDSLLFSTIVDRTENIWLTWDFSNSTAYSSFRINALNDYSHEPLALGWAMHRWELLADDGSTSPIPEPATILLFSLGIIGSFVRRRKRI